MSKHGLIDDNGALDPNAPFGSDDVGTVFNEAGLFDGVVTPTMLGIIEKEVHLVASETVTLAATAEAIVAALPATPEVEQAMTTPVRDYVAGDMPSGALPAPHVTAAPAPTTQQTAIMTSSIALGANVARALYGVTGAGLKIGIISDSFNAKGGAATDMANGILPNVTILSDATSGSDEGRAMLELAYSIAPGASYYTAEGSSLADEVTALKNAGVNIIVDDLSVGGEGLYQLGSATDVSIESAVASGVDYFTSAGNNATAYYEQGFAPLATTIAGIGAVTANDFGGGSPYLSLTIENGSGIGPIFQFAQPFGSFGTGANNPTNSLAIYLLDANGNIVASSTVDDRGGDPTQGFNFKNTTSNTAFRLVVVQNGGTVPAGELFKFMLEDGGATINSPNAGKGSGDLLGHEMLNDINVLGSVDVANTPAYGVSPAVIETGSSVGPGTILFDAQGNPITPVTQGVPQFESVDGTLTSSANTGFATSPFYGTSAAAPSAGAVGALVLQADRALTTAQVTSVLAQSVIPVTTLAPSSGAGLIQARAAVEIAAADAGDRWTTAAGGNWDSASSWSGGAAPTNAQAASLDDNLRGFTGQYAVTVSATGDVAGSLAIAAPAGSSSTLVVASGGGLAIGGSAANNITAGDLLVSDNGTLNVTGGTLSVSGSLNVNNGTVTVSLGSVTANNYAENSGALTVGGGGAATSLTLTGTGFAETGGTTTILSMGTLSTTIFTDSASIFGVVLGGAFIDSGSASFSSNAVLNDAGSFSVTGPASFMNTTMTVSGTFSDTGAASFTKSTIVDGGSFIIGSASISESTFTETGSLFTTGALNFDDTAATVAAGATINAGSLGVGTTFVGFTPVLTIAGRVTDNGNLGAGSSPVNGSIVLQTGGELDVGGTNNNLGITFAGNGLLAYTSSDTTLLANQVGGPITGLAQGVGAIDFTGLTYNSADTLAYYSDNGQVDVLDQSGTVVARTYLNTATNYTGVLKVQSDGASNHIEIVDVAPCYCPGTLILTPCGEIAVEDLAIGDLVVTASGGSEPIRWIGRRSYAGAFIAGQHLMLPVCFKKGSLADGVPHADLWVSPGHAMFVDGQLIPAWRLANGVSVVQAEAVDEVSYIHIELDRHEILLANGATAESFVDDDCRDQFHNSAEFLARYGDATALVPMQARLEDGFALQRIQERLATRAGVFASAEPVGALRGFLDQAGPGRVCGWAQDVDSLEEPVALEVLVDGVPVLCVLANGWRADLRKAGMGSGCHAFDMKLPDRAGHVSVRRATDGSELALTSAAAELDRRLAA